MVLLTELARMGKPKIQQRAGHRTFERTQKYIRTAEAVIGAAFPSAPRELPTTGRYRPEAYRPQAPLRAEGAK